MNVLFWMYLTIYECIILNVLNNLWMYYFECIEQFMNVLFWMYLTIYESIILNVFNNLWMYYFECIEISAADLS